MCPLRYLVALLSLILLSWAAISLLWLPDDAAFLTPTSGAGRVWKAERTWVSGAAPCIL